jgi:hypothetical protein
MYEAYFNYLKKFSSEPLTDDEKALIRQNFTPFSLRKRQYSLQAGNICRKFAFIVKGAMRMYSVDDKGQDSAGVFPVFCLNNRVKCWYLKPN